MNTSDAYDEIVTAIEAASEARLDNGAKVWLDQWLGEGMTHANEKRADVLAHDDGPMLVRGLVTKIRRRPPKGEGGTLTAEGLAAYSAELSRAATRLCD